MFECTVKGILDHVVETATKADLLYAVCIWKDPWDKLNYRVGISVLVWESTMNYMIMDVFST